jgi:hypothetical protein
MKKLLSICFLSILLGLLSFSTQAQSNNGSNSCASGFWIENLQPTTIHDIVNLPADMPNTGDLPLTHTLGQLWYGSTGQYLGNAHPGQTELYELHFCNTCNLDPKTKVSIDWLVIRDGDTINDHLSDYMEFSIYTFYNQLNQYGQCQSIGWMGGQVNDGFGYCEPVSGNYTLYDSIHGLNTGCHTPTNYPGALQVTQGTPLSVMTQLGQVVPAMGLNHVYTEALDYFYLDFFTQTRNIVQIKWKQVGDYKLVMRIRERTGGTAYNNLNWNDNETTDFIGGHQSCCGNVIAEDVISFPSFGESCMEVCENETYTVGRPAYTFTQTTPDTNVVFGQYVFDGTNCKYFQADSIYKFHFYERHTPQVVVLKSKDTLCRCESFTTAQLAQMIKFDTVDFQYASDHYFLWNHGTAANPTWLPEFPTLNNNLGTHTYQVLQVNKYSTCGFDTLCTGNPVTLTITFVEMQVPTITATDVEFCLDWIAADNTLQFTATSTPDAKCATTTRWYTKMNCDGICFWYNYIENPLYSYNKLVNLDTNTRLVGQGNNLAVNLADYVPSTNKDTVLYFFATSYDPVLKCESPKFSTVKVKLYQTPVLAPHITKTVYCPGSEVEMQVTINNGTSYNAPDYTYHWGGDATEVLLNGTRVPFVADQNDTVGTGNSGNTYFPFYTNAKNSYTQQIFTPAEVGLGAITKVTFDYNSTVALSKDVAIYFTTTNESAFNTSTRAWFTDNLQLAYEGTLNINAKGLVEIELQQPYVYTSTTENLVMAIAATSANTIAYGNNFKTSSCTGNKGMAYYGETKYANPNNIPANSTNRRTTANRNNVIFHVEGLGYTTNAKNQYAYYQMDPQDSCKTAYQTTAYVVDGHGCKSAPVEFNYISNDTINPTVNKATVTTDVYACHLDNTNAPIYTTVAALEAGANVQFSDNCDHQYLHIDGVTNTMTSKSDTTCHEVITRTYTIKDHCGNPVTFTQVFVSQDTVKPSFVAANGAFPYVRLFPVEGGNCTFNSPDSMTFVNAVAPFVHDNCTDSAYLMSTLVFNWENISESPIGATNIFREKNHLTVEATITDRCNNSKKALVIYIDRPEKISIKPNGITSTGNQCFGDTATLAFDPAFIVDDTIMGPFVPYTYAWSEVNGKAVTFTAADELQTEIIFPEPGDYTFQMTVTDRNGCFAVTEPITLNVRALPVMTINHIVLNGQTEPYCPTYGNLTVEAQIVNPVAGQTIAPHAYQWTGESVNVMSDSSLTWVTIVPEWCDTLYYPTVTVTDDRGCVGSVTDTIEVKANGPVFNASIPDTTVLKQAGCTFLIPNFKNLVDANLVGDDCYTFSQLKYSDAFGTIERTDWYSQSPAAGDTLKTASQVVTITVKNPCGKTATLNVNVLKPTDVLTVSILPTIDSLCQEEVATTGITYTATVSNELPAGSETYNWELIVKPTGSTATIPASHTAADLTVNQALEAGLYQYKVNVEDGLGCTTSATAELYVKFQGADPIVRTWPNTLCVRYNGALAVDTAPRGYTYTLEHQVYGNPQTKISDVPAHMPTDWTTIVFDSLRPGYYDLTVYTNEGCERTHVVFIDETSAAPAAPTFNTTDVTVCTNDNGKLNINALSGFTYQLYHYDGNVQGDLVGTATSYNNLSVGKYLIHAIQNSTKCEKDTTFTLADAAPRPNATYTTVSNNNCDNPDGIYTGKINITSNANWQYTVYSIDGTDTTFYLNDVTLTSSNNPISGLRQDYYYITAYNPANGCSSLNPVLVNNLQYTPVTTNITPTTTPNNFCVVDTANGTVKFTTLSNFIDYDLIKGADTVGKKADYTSAGWTNLAHGTYKIEATNKYYCHVTKTGVTVARQTIDPVITASQTMNPSCSKDLGSITLKNTNASAMNVSTYGNAHIASYKIEKGAFVKDSATTATQVTFNNLASGWYSYKATTDYGCFTTGTIEVEQYQLPAMQLDSTPNHMCSPTFEKPGDGTVTVVVPTTANVPGNHFFEYYFYDAADVNMEVPYELPLTNTKYWLAAKRYHVVALDTISRCQVEGYITVENDFYTVDFDYQTTVNYICNTSTVGNGSITVVNPTSTNPDAEFAYSLDGITYQTSPTFTGLKDGTYNVYVKDTTMQCLLSKPVAVSATDSCAPVLTICDNNGVCGDQFDYCYDAAGIQLCGTVNDTCNPTNIYTYGWYAPCANPHASNTACIDVQTNHYVVNGCDYIFTATNTVTGCSYSKTVNVAIHPNPQLKFTINGVDAATDHTNAYCENEELHIAVHALNSTEVVLDTTSIEWTLPAFIAGTGFADFYIKGDTITPDNITFCVRANSKFGCPSTIYSLPVTFKRIAHVTVDLTDQCVSCTLPYGEVITKPASATYPYSTTRVHNYTSVLTGCDSIVTYNVTLIAAPQFTATPTVAPFCEDENKTLADYEAGYTVDWNDVDPGTMKWMAASGTGTYNKVTSLANVTDGDYVITNAAGTKAMVNTHVTTSSNALGQTDADFTYPADNMVWQLVKNSDNTYSIYNASINKYIGASSSNVVQLLDNNTAANAKWAITMFTSGGTLNVRLYNNNTGRYLKYNTSSPRFACYDYNTGNTDWLALYKSDAGTYEEVASTTALTYDYVTTHEIKRVATNGCGSDEEALNLNGNVYKKPTINSFNLSNPYCASNTYDFTANVSTYGTPATAKLYIEGNTTPLATVSVNGLNQTVTFNDIKTPWAYRGKNLTLEVKNTNDFCDAVTSVKQISVDTAIINGLANSNVYCVGEQMTIDDFTGINPADYNTVTLKHRVGAVPAATDPEITLPYTFPDRTLNNAVVYVVASNSCFTNIVSNTATLKVNDKPSIAPIANIDVCASAYSLVDPVVTINGSDITAYGFLLKGTSGYATSNPNAIRNAARDHVVNAAYFATNSCGTDTVKFTVLVNDKPEVTLAASTMCPNAYVNSALTTTVNFHNINGIAGVDNRAYFVAKKTGVRDVINVATATFADIASYSTLWYIAENPCGADSAQVTINVKTNTFTAPVYQPACAGDQLSAFVTTAPSWTGSASITSHTWQVKIGATWTDATATTVINVPAPDVRYKWETECGDIITSTATTLTVNQKPELTLKSVAAVCSGSTIDPSTAIQTVTYHGNEDKYDTTYTVNGAAVTASTVYTIADNNKYLVVTITDNGQACGSVKDSVQIKVNPLPNPTITGPAKVCAGAPLSTPFQAQAGFINYVFTVKGAATPTPASPYHASGNTYDPTFALSTPLSSAHDTVFVTVENPITHCVGTSSTPAIIRITNAPEFIFKDSTGTETHTFSTMTGGDGLSYTWLVGVDCYTPDKLVYVEYDIYYNDVLIPNANIGDYLNTQHTAATPGHPAKDFVTKNYYEWCATDGTPRSDEILYNYSMANPSIGESGNHFPYSNLGLGTGHNYLDDLWLSFLAERPVKKTFVPFLRNGEYKVVYRLIATDNNQQLNEYYSPTCASITDLFPIGGHSALSSGYAQTLLAIDSITIHVGGPNLTPSTDPTNEEPVTPELAPVISNVETVAPDMEVWPNPAPAVETTLKARVHNMSGDATVTLTSLTGKQVYSGNIYIDNDNYYFEFNVNSLSVGSYIMTVRTDADVITKKVIVSRLAK